MSDTPRTDAADVPYFAIELPRFPGGSFDTTIHFVPSDFARQLERELNEANKSLATYRACNGSVTLACVTFPNVAEYINQIESERDQLRAEIGAWQSAFGTSQLSHALAERDKLRSEVERRNEILKSKGWKP